MNRSHQDLGLQIIEMWFQCNRSTEHTKDLSANQFVFCTGNKLEWAKFIGVWAYYCSTNCKSLVAFDNELTPS